MLAPWFTCIQCDRFVNLVGQDETAAGAQLDASLTPSDTGEGSLHALLKPTAPGLLQQVPLSPALPQRAPEPQLNVYSPAPTDRPPGLWLWEH